MCFFPPRYRQNNYLHQQANNESQTIEQPVMEEQEPEVKQQESEQQTESLLQTESMRQAESLPKPESLQKVRFLQQGMSSSQQEARLVQQEEGTSQQEVGPSQQEAEFLQQEAGYLPQETQPLPPPQQEVPSFKQEQQTQQQQSSVGVSAILLENLANTEGQIVRLKEQVDYAKIIIDEFLFKLDSIVQIMDIVRVNEVKSASLAEAQAVSYKSSKDSVDELLELFQGPIFQKLLRQFLIQIYVPNGGGTNLGRHS